MKKLFFDTYSSTYEVFFDFQNEESLENFGKDMELFDNNFIEKRSASFLHLSKCIYLKRSNTFIAGYWYEIPFTFLKENFVFNPQRELNSLIRYSLEYSQHKDNFGYDIKKYRIKNIEIDLFSKIFSSFKMIGYQNLFGYEDKLSEFKNNIYCNISDQNSFYIKDIASFKDRYDFTSMQNVDFIVRNVGCGNWNEVKSKYSWLIYDIGGDIKYSTNKMRSIIDQINFSQEYLLFLSHWDFDHYRGLLELSDDELLLMEVFFAPTKMPDIVQVKNVLNKLLTAKRCICFIMPSEKFGRTISLRSIGNIGSIEIFRSSDGRNINQSGITLSVAGRNSVAVLTGDHHYPQIRTGMLNKNIVNKKIELVIPHHGGSAGAFKPANWKYSNFKTVMSTRKGAYKNLPRDDIYNTFEKNSQFFCTDTIKKDYQSKL